MESRETHTNPEVSIVIRTLNEEKHIGNLLSALATQTYTNYEVILVDSGSKDNTLSIARSFGVHSIEIPSRDFTFGYSLNVGCRASRGKYLVCVSAHVLPTSTSWLQELIAPFSDEKVAMVYGRQQGYTTSKFSECRDFKRLFGTTTVNSQVPIHYANNANSAIRKSLWEKQPFDEYLFGLEDIDWARSMANEGYSIHYAPKASIYHIHEEKWYQVLNRYRREAIAAVRIGLDEPPQAKTGALWMVWYMLGDLIASFPDYTRARVSEIIRFRYFQSKGSRHGWKQGKHINFEIERNSIFYPEDNQSVVIQGKEKAAVVGVTVPDIKPGDILIKVDYVGVCRTDIEVYEGTLGYYRDGVASHPIVPGHEFSGTITKIGSNNKFQERFKIGDRVVGECILSRGEDGARKEVGVINYNGAYSTYVVMPGDAIHKIPDAVDSKTAVLTEPLAVVLRALRRTEARLTPGARVAVIGAGQIGNLATQVLALRGYQVTLFDRDEKRLGMLRGSNCTTSTTITDLDQFEVIIEATGSRSVLETVLKESVVNSTIVLLGFPYGAMTYNFEDVVGLEKVLIGSVGADTEDFQMALTLLTELDMSPFTEVVMPLREFEDAWKVHKTFRHLKILLQP